MAPRTPANSGCVAESNSTCKMCLSARDDAASLCADMSAFAARTVPCGGAYNGSRLDIAASLFISVAISAHLSQPVSRCSCIFVVASGDTAPRARSSHSVLSKWVIIFPPSLGGQQPGSGAVAVWDLGIRDGRALKNIAAEKFLIPLFAARYARS